MTLWRKGEWVFRTALIENWRFYAQSCVDITDRAILKMMEQK